MLYALCLTSCLNALSFSSWKTPCNLSDVFLGTLSQHPSDVNKVYASWQQAKASLCSLANKQLPSRSPQCQAPESTWRRLWSCLWVGKQRGTSSRLTCPAGGAAGRSTSSASTAGVVAWVASVLKLKFPWGTVQNAVAVIQNPRRKAGFYNLSEWLLRVALSIRTCGIHVLLYRSDFIFPETKGMPGTDQLRTWEVLVTYPSLAQDFDPTAGTPETGWGFSPLSGSKEANCAHRD